MFLSTEHKFHALFLTNFLPFFESKSSTLLYTRNMQGPWHCLAVYTITMKTHHAEINTNVILLVPFEIRCLELWASMWWLKKKNLIIMEKDTFQGMRILVGKNTKTPCLLVNRSLNFVSSFLLTVKRSGKVEKSNFKTFKTQGLEWYFYYSNLKVANLSFILSSHFPGIRIQLKAGIAWSEFCMTLWVWGSSKNVPEN